MTYNRKGERELGGGFGNQISQELELELELVYKSPLRSAPPTFRWRGGPQKDKLG